VHGQENRPRPWRNTDDLPGGVEPVQQRHGQIEHGHVRARVARPPDGFLAVGGFPDDLEALALQQTFQPLAEDQVIVG